ncbi:transketolase, partial [bacterium]|nr:transketolase [bacterium]
MEKIQGTENQLAESTSTFEYYEKTKDLVDQLIDIILNYRQSGHPGGSRSKVHALLVTLLSGAMRWDIRNPEKAFGDRFILVGGHTIPLIYSTLTILNEAMRIKFAQTGDAQYAIQMSRENTLYWEDLLQFRENGGLSGHAEMEGKTLFLKFNTGPSGHGAPVADGEALALKRAGAGDVRVFAFDGEGGMTPGGVHEALNSAYGLGLDNLYYVLDWNDFGIDSHKVSSVVYGTPEDWFGGHGWRVFGTEQGSEWAPVSEAVLQAVNTENPEHRPNAIWVKTRKGRGYYKYDYASHGAPHKTDSDLFWQTKKDFADKYRVEFTNFGCPPPSDKAAYRHEYEANLKAVIEVLHSDQALVDFLADTLVTLGNRVPESISGFKLGSKGNPFKDARLYDYQNYPPELFAQPGEKVANRAGMAKWGAWANALGAKDYGRPLFVVASADLAES